MKTVVVRRACRYWLIPWKQKETVKWETFFHLIPSVVSSLIFWEKTVAAIICRCEIKSQCSTFLFSQVIMEKHFFVGAELELKRPWGQQLFFRAERSLSSEQQPNEIWTVAKAKWKLNDLSNLTPMLVCVCWTQWSHLSLSVNQNPSYFLHSKFFLVSIYSKQQFPQTVMEKKTQSCWVKSTNNMLPHILYSW